jgi:hypothetical protein
LGGRAGFANVQAVAPEGTLLRLTVHPGQEFGDFTLLLLLGLKTGEFLQAVKGEVAETEGRNRDLGIGGPGRRFGSKYRGTPSWATLGMGPRGVKAGGAAFSMG